MFKKPTAIIGLILTVAIVAISLVGQAVSYAVWPGFFVVLLYFIAKSESLSALKDIVVGGLVGILWSYGVSFLIGFLAPSIGISVSFPLILAASIFLLVVLGDIMPMMFNNFAFIYYLTAANFPEQKPIEWMGSILIVGGIYAVMVFGGMKLFLPQEPKKPETKNK